MRKKTNSSKSIFKRLLVLATAMVLICAFFTSCMGNTQTTVTVEGDVKLNDTDGISQTDLNNIAKFVANNEEAYQGLVAAYRGYDILNDTVEEGKVYAPIYETVVDDEENETEILKVNVDAAKAVLAKHDTKNTLDYEKLDREDVINLVEKLKQNVTFEAKKDLLNSIMYGIGVALGWITNTLGFGNYIIGICIFAIFLEILMLPMAISRQKNSIKQAKLRPKEMAIRKKYAGRNDQVTMQKVQTEIQEMYRKENFNPASGCLPLLIQLPVIMVLYNIVVDPLTHVLGKAGNFSQALQIYFKTSPLAGGFGGTLYQQKGNGSIEVLSKIREVGLEAFEGIKNFDFFNNGEEIFAQIESIYESIPSFNIGSSINLGYIPSFERFDWLLLVPVLTFVVYFGSMKLSKKFMYQPTQTENQPGAGCSNNIMDISMPLMSVFFTFAVPAVIGVYWMFKSVLSTIQQFIVAKVMPIPTFTEEDYKAAEKELGVKNKKNTEKKERDPSAPRPRSLHHIDDEDYNEQGELKPAPKAPEVKASETPVGAAPLKNDEPEHKAKKDKKSEKDAPEAEKAEKNNEENK